MPDFATLEMVMVLLVPTFWFVNTPEVEVVEILTLSPEITPTNAAEPRLSITAVVWSYTLLLAVIPVTVSSLVVMLAVVVGWVSV